MVLITGGLFQGKLDFARETYNVAEEDIFYGETDLLENVYNAKVIYGLHFIVKRWLCENIVPEEEIEKISAEIIICDEVGAGVVPIDKFERQWREKVGRCSIIIGKKAESVIRMFYGIPTVLK